MVNPSLSRVVGVWVPVTLFAIATAIGLAAPEALTEHGELLFLASVVFLGLPHGAVDHLVIARLEGAPLFSSKVAAWIVGYLGLVAVTLVFWSIAPVVVFAGFILLTWFHWGQGDNWFQMHEWGAPPGWDAVVVAGALPMLVPLAAHPEIYAGVAEAFVAAAGVEAELSATIEALRWPAAGIVAVAACVRLVRLVRSGGAWMPVLFEVVLLLLFFSVVTPVAAIALYFCLWHSTRHIVRLSQTVYSEDWSGALRTLWASMPLTLVSIAGLAGLTWWTGGEDLFSLYLALIAALTVPHVVVVSWMDRRAGVGMTS